MKRKKETLDYNIFLKAVSDLKETNINHVVLSPIVGEVLLDPFFFDRVNILHECGYMITTFTNLMALDEYDDSTIYRLLSQVSTLLISMAPNHEAHNELYRRGDFARVVKNLSKIALMSKESPCNILVQIRKSLLNNSIDPEVEQQLKNGKLITIVQDYEYLNWGGAITNRDGIQVVEHSPERNQTPCNIAQRPVIYSSGEVGFCPCSDYDGKMKIGDLRTDSLISIISNHFREKLVSSFWEGTEPAHCKKCSFYKPYEGENY